MVSEFARVPKTTPAVSRLARQVHLAEVVQDDVSDAALVDRVGMATSTRTPRWSTAINRRRFDWPRW